MKWDYLPTAEFDAWFDTLEQPDQEQVIAAVRYLQQEGPVARFPVSRPISQPNSCAMRELRPGSSGRSELRILYAFDPFRSIILLLGGDKSGRWNRWYDEQVPFADRLFQQHLTQMPALPNVIDQRDGTKKRRRNR